MVSNVGGRLHRVNAYDFVIYRVSDERRQAMARTSVNNADVNVTSRGIELLFTGAR